MNEAKKEKVDKDSFIIEYIDEYIKLRKNSDKSILKHETVIDINENNDYMEKQ